RLDPGVGRTGNLFMEALHEARFANPSLAHDQRHLALAVLGTLPPTHQQMQFVLAPDKWGESVRSGCRFQPPTGSAGSYHPVQTDWPCQALQGLWSAILNHEQSRDQTMGILGRHHRVRSSRLLRPGGDVGRVAEHVGLLAGTHPTTTEPESIPTRADNLGRVG